MALVAWCALSYARGGVVSDIADPQLDAAQKLEALRTYFESWGSLAPLVYVVIVTVEVVVAPIPGAMLYLPGGVIFGGFWGGLLSLVGNVLGAGLACGLTRTIVGRRWSESFFDGSTLRKYKVLLERRGMGLIALLRVNPLTSSDIVSYAAGLTTVPIWKVMAGTCVGMAPLCFVQSYFAGEVIAAAPWLIWPLVVACIVLRRGGRRDRRAATRRIGERTQRKCSA